MDISPGLIGGVVAGALVAWLMNRARIVAPVEDGVRVLRYGTAWRALVGIATTGGVALVALLFVMLPEHRLVMSLVVVGTLFAAAALVAEVARVRIELRDDGIRFRGLITPWSTIRWEELRTVGYNLGATWFVLRSANGVVARVPQTLHGISSFADEILSRSTTLEVGSLARRALENLRTRTGTART